jgi:hypothetical protein
MVLSAAIYLLVALGRSNVYAAYSIPPWQAATTGRYHYVGTIPIVALLCLALAEVGRRLPAHIPRASILVAGLTLLVTGRLCSDFVIDEHYPVRTYVLRTLEEFSTAAAREPRGTTVYLENGVSPTDLLGAVLPNYLFPGRAAIFLLTNRTDERDGRRFRFVERDPVTLARIRSRPDSRLDQLVLAPEEAPWM